MARFALHLTDCIYEGKEITLFFFLFFFFLLTTSLRMVLERS